MQYIVRLEQFEGPLDLLLFLIRKSKMNIEDIMILPIIDQYFEYMEQIIDVNVEAASEFLVMAATLLEIKSRALLPARRDEELAGEEDPETLLIRRLEEYERFKQASETLQTRAEAARMLHYKSPESIEVPVPEIDAVSVDVLYGAFEAVLARLAEREADTTVAERTVRRELFTVPQKMLWIREKLAREKTFSFQALFLTSVTREEVITTFMALLEMIRLGHVKVRQKKPFEDILVQQPSREREGSADA